MTEDDRNIDPWDPWGRRRRAFSPFFDFDEIDQEFARMKRYMDAFMRNAIDETNSEPKEGENRYVYGFTIRMGPEGKPIIQEFGNTKPDFRSPQVFGAREPLVDVNDCPDAIAITAELPGVEKQEVELVIDEYFVEIKTTGQVQFYKHIDFDCSLDKEKAQATYKNGILDIQVPKKSRGETAGRRVPVD
ncbi:MAG: Hsp20/alpha crystallin family protein [Candidatus Thermoplasmatota archaeon]|nr:Hsp20/alpha crystallin family protein [Candidatus Thermoplasmatota archaeon]